MVIKLKKMMQERKKHMFLSISIIILSISIKTKYVLPSKNKNNQKIGMMVQREKTIVKQYTNTIRIDYFYVIERLDCYFF